MSVLGIRQAVAMWFLLVYLFPVPQPAFGEAAPDIHTLHTLYANGDYQKTLEELAKLAPETAGEPDVRRLKIRTLLRVGNPKEAVTEYDKLAQRLTRDDQVILREVALAFVVGLTKDMREQMRGAAYTALKEWKSPETIPFFEGGLTDDSGLVRALAAEGLGAFPAGHRSKKFRQALDDQAVLVREAVLKGLSKSDDASVVPLIEPMLKDPEVRVRVAAAEALCHFKRSKACELLVRYAKAPNPDEQTSAIRALVERQPTQVMPILMVASEHTQPSVRGAAATGFGQMPSTKSVPVLARLLRDPLTPVRIAAAVSLGKTHDSDARLPLTTALNDRDFAVRAFVIGALLELGERYDVVAPSVRLLINAKEPAIRAAVARALGHAGQTNREPAASALMVLVQDTVPRVRIAAVRAMTKVGGASAIDLFKERLHDDDDAVRATAGGALLAVMAPTE